MKSPFPGMDPYLERHWRDVHTRLTAYSTDALNESLPGALAARCEERVVIDAGEWAPQRVTSPDVRIIESGSSNGTKSAPAGGVATAPILFEMLADSITEPFIEIRDSSGQTLITVIEFISPTNKRHGPDRERYLPNRRHVFDTGVNVVEIDLVRAGSCQALLLPYALKREEETSYRAVVWRATTHRRGELYLIPLGSPLPQIGIPLRDGEADVTLALQPLIENVYVRGRYAQTIDYARPCDPPLSETEMTIAKPLLEVVSRR